MGGGNLLVWSHTVGTAFGPDASTPSTSPLVAVGVTGAPPVAVAGGEAFTSPRVRVCGDR